jgi:ribulose-phosphate 3-epimerase
MTLRIAASLLSADFTRLGEEVRAVLDGGADLIHLDVMDGHFVPNLTMGPMIVAAVKRISDVPLDVHLMISDPDRYIDSFADAGASMLTVHTEVLPHLHRTIQAIKRLGCKAGVALNPSTPIGVLEDVAGDLDYVLVMSVNPGFGGQAFIPRTESKLRAVRALLDAAGNAGSVEVDGGIDVQTAARVTAAGADVLVVGAAIFSQTDRVAATRQVRAAAQAAHV